MTCSSLLLVSTLDTDMMLLLWDMGYSCFFLVQNECTSGRLLVNVACRKNNLWGYKKQRVATTNFGSGPMGHFRKMSSGIL
jgi:hypothetical protein